jgi:hypothetical protein
MDISGIKFPRTVQEILYGYQQGILKSETREQSGESHTPGGMSRFSDPRKRGTKVSAATRKDGPCPAHRADVVAERSGFARRRARRTVTKWESSR